MAVEEKFKKVDSIQLETLTMFLDESKDFRKLDETDQLVVAWIVQKAPKSLRSWIDYVRNQYAQQSFDADRLLKEIDQIMKDMKWV